jgi:plastocyanin
MPATTVVGLILGSVAVVTIAATSSNYVTDSTNNPSTTTESAAKARVVQVTGEDFKFDAPDVIPAGLTEFRFLNKGPALHHMALLKLTGGKTVDDLVNALGQPGPLPPWAKELGGPNAAAPGEEANATLTLEPGNYAFICFVDIGGPPHFAKGMVKPLRVVPSTSPSGPKPKADVTATLFDYNFKLSAPVRAGKRTIRVHNTGPQVHEVQLVQLAPGASLGEFMKWLEKMEGPPPGKPLGGIAGIESGMSQYFSADFVPGSYALICFVPDGKDRKPHFVHGMVQQFEVK